MKLFSLQDEDMLRSDHHWKEGVLELAQALASLLDYALTDETMHRWLWGRGYKLLGDPEEPSVKHRGVAYYALYLQDRLIAQNSVENMKDHPERLKDFLEYRDRLINTSHQLLHKTPEHAYLLCMNVQYQLQRRAQDMGEDIDNPQYAGSPYHLMKLAAQVMSRLRFIYDSLNVHPDTWKKRYEETI